MTRYSDTVQLDSVWLQLIEWTRDKLRAMRVAGDLEGIDTDDQIEVRKLPYVTKADVDAYRRMMFIVPAPEQRFDKISNNVNQGLKLGVLITAWSVSDGDLFGDTGRILRWRGQMWNPANGLNTKRAALTGTSIYVELEPGPVFDPAAWADNIDQTTMVLRGMTRAGLA